MVQRSRKQTFCILLRGGEGKSELYTSLADNRYCFLYVLWNHRDIKLPTLTWEGKGLYKRAFPHVLVASTNRFKKEAVQHISQAFRLIAPTFPIGWCMSGMEGTFETDELRKQSAHCHHFVVQTSEPIAYRTNPPFCTKQRKSGLALIVSQAIRKIHFRCKLDEWWLLYF